MPTSGGDVCGFRSVNGHARNTADGVQAVTAFGLLANVADGCPVLLSEMTLLTAMRIAATSALVAKMLALKISRAMAMVDNGAQSEVQTLAMKATCDITRMRLDDSDSKTAAKCAANLAVNGLDVTSCSSAEEAILTEDPRQSDNRLWLRIELTLKADRSFIIDKASLKGFKGREGPDIACHVISAIGIWMEPSSITQARQSTPYLPSRI